MRTIALLLVSVFSCFQASSQNEFTVGNIYDFEPGDLFQYSYDILGTGYGEQDEILDKYYSENNDTVFYIVEKTEWLVDGSFEDIEYDQFQDTVSYTNLDSLLELGPYEEEFFESGSTYCVDSIMEHIYIEPVDFEASSYVWKYAPGLGLVYHSQSIPVGSFQFSYHLSYYSKGDETCGNYSSMFDEVNVSELEEVSMKVFPNPSAGEVNISASFVIRSIQVLNLRGEIIHNDQNVFSDYSKLDLNTLSLSDGIYFIRIRGEKGQLLNEKLIRQ